MKTKVKLKIDSIIQAGFQDLNEFFDINGNIIDQSKHRIQVIELCLDSSPYHPVP